MVPQPDGAGAIPIMLHAELAALGERHEVTFVAAAGDEPGEAEAAAELASSGLDVHIADRGRPPPGVDRWRRRLRLAGTWARGRWPWRTVWFADPAVQAVLDRLAATRNFDLTAVEDSSMSVFRLPAGVPSVLTEHEVRRPRSIDWRAGPPSAWPGWAFGELDWQRWKRFQHGAWRRFDLVQVFGERDAEAIAELAPELATRVRVNPFGLVMPAAADPAREMPGMVLFVGNFTHRPNRAAATWLAQEIMPAVRARQPGARLRLVGSSAPDEILDLAGPDVDLEADAPSVRPHLEAAAVVVAPVRSGGGMRMKVLEAMAAGKPVVTTLRGAEGFNVLDRDLPLLVAESREEVAEATAALLEDDRRRRELGRRAREFAQRHHSPAAWGARLERVFEEARENRPAGAC
jgi:glycosyltransferase involved in cell wall biosynthesis